MRTHNYFYFGTPIQKSRFEENVPKNWREDPEELGVYYWGGYKAISLNPK
jgi:hypothetical protein